MAIDSNKIRLKLVGNAAEIADMVSELEYDFAQQTAMLELLSHDNRLLKAALEIYSKESFWNDLHPELEMCAAHLDQGINARTTLGSLRMQY